MKKLTLILLGIFFISPFVFSQSKDLISIGNEKNTFLIHNVAAKQSFFSIGRLYNVSAKELAAFNNLDLNSGLAIDQELKVPLSLENFNQKNINGIPVYYIIKDGEGLLKVSNNNNKVSLAQLREWNSLAGDEIAKGQKLVVGFLLSNEMKSDYITAIDKNATVTTDIVKEPVIAKNEEKPAVANTIPEKAEEKKETIVQAAARENVVAFPENKIETGKAGYFQSAYEKQAGIIPSTKKINVSSGIFKTISGWQDGKYYLLLDGAEPGTLVKITNPDNGKVICAKVLGEMAGIIQNKGLEIRISNAAASALQIPEANTEKFSVEIVY